MAREIMPDTTVGQAASLYPELIPELERLGIDYCCGGGRTLREAAAAAGVSASELVTGLTGYASDRSGRDAPPDCARMSMTALADHIEQTHHVFARQALERLGVLTAKCVAADGADHPRLVELQHTVAALTDDMHDHFVREERVLFPWLRRLERKSEIQGGPPWSVRRPIDCMVHDHDDVGDAFRKIRDLTDGLSAPESACATWRECYRLLTELERDTHLHIHKENNILFPAGIAAEERVGNGPARRVPNTEFARGGFALVELLVAVAIIALLIGALLPTLGRSRSAGRAAVCLDSSRPIATAMPLY